MNSKLRLTVVLIAMIIINWGGYRFIYEDRVAKSFFDGWRIWKHIFNFLWLLIIFLMGYCGWYNYKVIWTKKIWLISYCFIIVLMIVLGIIDLMMKGFSADMKDATGYLRFFFQSPMPFVLLWFLSSVQNKNDNIRKWS